MFSQLNQMTHLFCCQDPICGLVRVWFPHLELSIAERASLQMRLIVQPEGEEFPGGKLPLGERLTKQGRVMLAVSEPRSAEQAEDRRHGMRRGLIMGGTMSPLWGHRGLSATIED